MAVYRQIYISFWTDQKIDDDFSPEDKYFYLYLLTNPHVNICGCYGISDNQMIRETGYNYETCKKLLNRMESIHKVIKYNSENKEVLLLNWHKYNWADSEKTLIGIYNSAETIKTKEFREYIQNLALGGVENTPSMGHTYPIQGVSISTVTDTVSVSVPVTDTVTDTVPVNKKKKEKKPKQSKAEINLLMYESLKGNYVFSNTVSDQIKQWLTYKGESNFSYKETGMKAFLSQTQKKISEFGDAAVCALMEECAGNGWQGVIWSKLSENHKNYKPTPGEVLERAAQKYRSGSADNIVDEKSDSDLPFP